MEKNDGIIVFEVSGGIFKAGLITMCYFFVVNFIIHHFYIVSHTCNRCIVSIIAFRLEQSAKYKIVVKIM